MPKLKTLNPTAIYAKRNRPPIQETAGHVRVQAEETEEGEQHVTCPACGAELIVTAAPEEEEEEPEKEPAKEDPKKPKAALGVAPGYDGPPIDSLLADARRKRATVVRQRLARAEVHARQTLAGVARDYYGPGTGEADTIRTSPRGAR